MALILLVFGALTYYGLLQMRDERLLGTLSEALQVPQWVYTLAVPLGSVLIVVRALQRTLVLWRDNT